MAKTKKKNDIGAFSRLGNFLGNIWYFIRVGRDFFWKAIRFTLATSIFLFVVAALLISILDPLFDNETKPKADGKVVVFSPDGIVVDQQIPKSQDQFTSFLGDEEVITYEFKHLVNFFEKFKEDEKVSGMIFDPSGLQISSAYAIPLAKKIKEAAQAGKEIIIRAESLSIYGDTAYLLSSGANEISASKYSAFALDGFTSTRFYQKDFFEKFLLTPRVFTAGDWKTGPEDWTRSNMSQEQKDNSYYIDRFWNAYKNFVKETRDVDLQWYADESYKDLIAGNVSFENANLEWNIIDYQEEEARQEKKSEEAPEEKLISPKKSNLIPEFTFNSFVEGKSNHIALAASKQIGDGLKNSYNPLFIYGGVGLGKTHLMHAVGNKLLEKDSIKKIAYVHSERFVSDMVKSLQLGAISEFKQYYRSLDALLIDDIQFFAKKEQSQEELFHTFNSLLERGSQMILTCDRYPKEIDGLEDRLKSRLGWGLPVVIEPPELETRVAILLSKAKSMNHELDEESAFFIAQKVRSNVRYSRRHHPSPNDLQPPTGQDIAATGRGTSLAAHVGTSRQNQEARCDLPGDTQGCGARSYSRRGGPWNTPFPRRRNGCTRPHV